MKVTCQSCQAKYTIADEKVRGKVAKIRCKKCGTTIIVNGTEGASAEPSEHPVADYTQQGSNTDQWTVLVSEGDQRTVSAADLTKLYLGGEINYETMAWKDGMAEWLPIAQIDALKSVLDNGPQPTMTPFAEAAPAAQTASEPPPPEPVVPAPPMFNVAAAAPAAKPIGARPRAPEAAAARRAGRGGSADLFGAPAQDEVLTSAAANPVLHAPAEGGDKLTGARNENSVLFSLSALTGAPGGGGGGGSSAASSEVAGPASSKADLRALVSGADKNGRPAPAKSGLDDIMNLGGGGVYSPALMAPALAPPPVDFASAADTSSSATSAKPKSKAMLFGILGVVVVGGAAAFFMLGGSKESDKTSGVASAMPSAAAPTTAAEAPKAPDQPAAAATATAEPTAESAPTVLAPGQAAPKPEADKKVAKVDKPDKPSAAPPLAAAIAPAPEKPAAPAAPAAPAPASGADFDRAAAMSALSAAATAAQSCKKADGPTGSGRIAVTFANSGAATTAAVEGPPFAGTPVGGCVAARFRGVHVPAYGGATVTVHKTFSIN
jgi:predicted Zn finger-like uncharacterized protein